MNDRQEAMHALTEAVRQRVNSLAFGLPSRPAETKRKKEKTGGIGTITKIALWLAIIVILAPVLLSSLFWLLMIWGPMFYN